MPPKVEPSFRLVLETVRDLRDHARILADAEETALASAVNEPTREDPLYRLEDALERAENALVSRSADEAIEMVYTRLIGLLEYVQ